MLGLEGRVEGNRPVWAVWIWILRLSQARARRFCCDAEMGDGRSERYGQHGDQETTVSGKWTALQRQEIVEASLVAGASINEVAERYGIRADLLTAWRRRLDGVRVNAVPMT